MYMFLNVFDLDLHRLASLSNISRELIIIRGKIFDLHSISGGMADGIPLLPVQWLLGYVGGPIYVIGMIDSGRGLHTVRKCAVFYHFYIVVWLYCIIVCCVGVCYLV